MSDKVSICAVEDVNFTPPQPYDPKGRERIDAWLLAEAQPSESAIWVGENYSLEQLKRDVMAEIFHLEEESDYHSDWNTKW